MDVSFWREKNVFVTGHTGFKGSWLCQLLKTLGANVTGYALAPQETPSLFGLCAGQNGINSIIGDIRDLNALGSALKKAQPEIVFHLAAQPLVRQSYKEPAHTYEVNVMGTVNILESIKNSGHVKSFLNVTTDKVYKNNEWCWPYREKDTLNGHDPYSNSKSCSELITHSYNACFLAGLGVGVSTARAGNVIGGGDFAKDRIVPDCVRAAEKGQKIALRNPNSVRPYQHVLEPIFAYLLIAQSQFLNTQLSASYNVGPDENDCVSTKTLADIFCTAWGENLSWFSSESSGPHEANFLKLDCSLIKNTLGWKPVWNVEKAVKETVAFSKQYLQGANVAQLMDRQIKAYVKDMKGGLCFE